MYKRQVFISDEGGVLNLYRGSLAVGSYYRFTDVLGGIQLADYAPERDRLVFSAFSYAGYDLFMMDAFSEKSTRSYSTGSPAIASAEEPAAPVSVRDTTGDGDTPEPAVARIGAERAGDSAADTATVARADSLQRRWRRPSEIEDDGVTGRLRITGSRRREIPPDMVAVSYTHLTLPTNREV